MVSPIAMPSITISFFTFIFFFFLAAVCHAANHPGPAREAIEIIIGGGSNSPPSPPPDCPPLPPPPCPPPSSPFESKRIELVYPVIQNLKRRIRSDPLGVTNTWVGPDICQYKGFFCAVVPDYKVKALARVNFNGFNLAGPDLSLHGFLDQLPDVTLFHANSNQFTGTVPGTLANLRYLFELDLSNNKLSGDFPVEVLGATKLTFLDLRFNSFSGAVPPRVFNLDLDVLFINNNGLMQTLPDEIGATPVLFLTLANNKFTGEIPRSIGKASRTLLEVLLLNNRLSGCLPCEIGLLGRARVFDASRNLLTGPIPHSFGCLAHMEVLNLAQNQLYGPVPETVCQLAHLANLSLSYNYFTLVGPICMKLIERKVLDVRMNCILGLPMQRSKAQCVAFFSRPITFPDPKWFNWVPCRPNSQKQSDRRLTAQGASLRSFEALVPHRL